jgi:hypothetical protein
MGSIRLGGGDGGTMLKWGGGRGGGGGLAFGTLVVGRALDLAPWPV